jgi:hypothetical protein
MPRCALHVLIGVVSDFLPIVQHIATLASIYKADKYTYPKEKLDDSWEKVLLNQCTFPFHLFGLRHLCSRTTSI